MSTPKPDITEETSVDPYTATHISAKDIDQLDIALTQYERAICNIEAAYPGAFTDPVTDRMDTISRKAYQTLCTLHEFDRDLRQLFTACQKHDSCAGNITADQSHVISAYLQRLRDTNLANEYEIQALEYHQAHSGQTSKDDNSPEIAILSAILKQSLELSKPAGTSDEACRDTLSEGEGSRQAIKKWSQDTSRLSLVLHEPPDDNNFQNADLSDGSLTRSAASSVSITIHKPTDENETRATKGDPAGP